MISAAMVMMFHYFIIGGKRASILKKPGGDSKMASSLTAEKHFPVFIDTIIRFKHLDT